MEIFNILFPIFSVLGCLLLMLWAIGLFDKDSWLYWDDEEE